MSLKDTSKFISLILRHKPEAIGIKLDENGWASVEELIAGVARTRVFNMEMLEEIVKSDEKKRYSFNADKTKIRANQGHSVRVDVELEERTPPPLLYHGTGEKFLPSIEKTGLIPKTRLYVHLSAEHGTALTVGARHGKPIVFAVNTEKMARDGYKFFISANGVWLTSSVPPEYLERITEI